MISVTCSYVLMDQGWIFQGTFGKNMLRVLGREKINLKIII